MPRKRSRRDCSLSRAKPAAISGASVPRTGRTSTRDPSRKTTEAASRSRACLVGRNAEVQFHGERRTNDTHASTTDPQARLYRKSNNTAATLCFAGHLLMENRNALIVDTELTRLAGRLSEEGVSGHALEEMAQTVRRVVDKLLHAPTVRVKELASSPDGEEYAAALRVLFDLDPRTVDAVTHAEIESPNLNLEGNQ